MYTAAALKAYTLKDLAQMAKKRGIRGWHAMRKEELIRALLRAHSPQRKSTTRSKAQPSAGRKKAASARSTSRTPAKKKPTAGRTRAVRRIRQVHADRDRQRDLAGEPKAAGRNGHAANGKAQRDRIVLMVRDPYWLHAHWELTRGSVQRAQAALAEHWHTAKPFLRLVEVEGGHTTSTAESSARFIPIHGGVCHWYIDVPDPPKNYRVEVGYRAASGKFYSLARSNQVTTPRPGDADIDENWSSVEEDYERIYALSGGYSADTDNGDLQELFEERLRRPMGPPSETRFGVGAEGMLGRTRGYDFDVNAEMIVFGHAEPESYVTVAGEPVKLRSDGSFSVRLALPDRRQVLPVVAASSDGVQQRTIVLAVERNTKVMEPVSRDNMD